jgi:hypothetical protein
MVAKGGLADVYDSPAVLVRPDHFVAWVADDTAPQAVLRRAIGQGA